MKKYNILAERTFTLNNVKLQVACIIYRNIVDVPALIQLIKDANDAYNNDNEYEFERGLTWTDNPYMSMRELLEFTDDVLHSRHNLMIVEVVE